MKKQNFLIAAAIAIMLAGILFPRTLMPQTAEALSIKTQTITANGTIVSGLAILTLNSSSNPTKTGSPTVISGQVSGLTNYNNLTINIQYSQNQLNWQGISTVTTQLDGTFGTTFAFPSAGTYYVRATYNSQAGSYIQTVADSILNGSGNAMDIQAAIDALPSTGGTVYVKKGFYELGGRSVTLRSNLVFIGEGIDQTIIRMYSTKQGVSVGVDDAFTSSSQITNLVLKDFTLIQNADPRCDHGGIVLRGSLNKNITVTSVKVTDVSGGGISVQNYAGLLVENCVVERSWTGIMFANGSDAVIRGNTVVNTVGDGIFPQLTATAVTIENNHLTSIGDTAIDITARTGYAPETNIIVRGNVIQNGTIRVCNAIDVQITGNIINGGQICVDAGQGRPVNVRVNGNQIVSNGRAGIGFYGAANCSAENNLITMQPSPTGSIQSGMVAAIWGTGLIQNNTILNAGNYGIDFEGWGLGSSSNVTIKGNTIRDYGNYGIYDNNVNEGPIRIENNSISSNKPTATQQIYAQNPTSQWIINGNT